MFHLSMFNGLAPSSATLSTSAPLHFVQLTPETNFPRLISPTFRAVIAFKQQLEAWKQAHPVALCMARAQMRAQPVF